MPIYEYVPDSGQCDQCSGRFELVQPIDAEPITRCPHCGQACHRVFSAFMVGTSTHDVLSAKNLEEKGFTQYTRAGDGYYERTAGKQGPKELKRP